MSDSQLDVSEPQSSTPPPEESSPPTGGRFRQLGRWRIAVIGLIVVVLAAGGWLITSRLLEDTLSDGVVAQVGDSDITTEQFASQQRLVLYQATVALIGPEGLRAADLHLVPLQGDAGECAEWIRRYASEAQLAATTDEQLRETCQARSASLRDDTLAQLLAAQINLEVAPGLGATIDQSVFDERLQQVYEVFGGEEKLATLEAASGITDADLRERLRQGLLDDAVEAKVKAGADTKTVTDADRRRYYQENSGQFVDVPQKRDASIVLAKTEGSAEQARQRIEGGESFAAVAKELTIDPAPKRGAYSDVAAADVPASLRSAVFSAAQGALTGPTQTDDGWALVRVESITPAVPASFEDSVEAIRRYVPGAKPGWAWTDFQAETAAEWLPRIICASDYHSDALCGA